MSVLLYIIQTCSQQVLLGILLKEMWTFPTAAIQPINNNHNPGAADELISLIFYGARVCIAHIPEDL